MKFASAGSMESNDCLITVYENDKLIIDIHSIVFEQFGDDIKKVIEDTLDELNLKNIHVKVEDKGALDYTIKARLITAIERLSDIDA